MTDVKCPWCGSHIAKVSKTIERLYPNKPKEIHILKNQCRWNDNLSENENLAIYAAESKTTPDA